MNGNRKLEQKQDEIDVYVLESDYQQEDPLMSSDSDSEDKDDSKVNNSVENQDIKMSFSNTEESFIDSSFSMACLE